MVREAWSDQQSSRLLAIRPLDRFRHHQAMLEQALEVAAVPSQAMEGQGPPHLLIHLLVHRPDLQTNPVHQTSQVRSRRRFAEPPVVFQAANRCAGRLFRLEPLGLVRRQVNLSATPLRLRSGLAPFLVRQASSKPLSFPTHARQAIRHAGTTH